MAIRRIPNEGIVQMNRGDVYGDLWATFNIDLETSPGKVRAARRLDATATSTKMNNDNVHAFSVFDGDIEVTATDRRLVMGAERNPRISNNWTSSTGSTTALWGGESDSVVFNNMLLVSGNNDIASINAAGTVDEDWWTAVTSGTITNATSPHILEVIKSGTETMIVTDGNLVRYYNSTAGHSTVTLNENHTACALTTSLDRTWVGTFTNSGNALVYEIAIGNTTSSNAYEVDGSVVLSIETIENTPYIVTDRGHVQRFNGVGFVTIASFPFAFKSVIIDGCFPGDIKLPNIERGIHPRGMRSKDHYLYILVNTHNELIDQLASNPTDDDDVFDNVVVDERSPSGIWCCDTRTGSLWHRAALTHGSDSKGYHELVESGPLWILDNQYSRFLAGGVAETDRTEIFAEATSGNYGYFITPEYISTSVKEAFDKVVIKTKPLASGETVTLKYRHNQVDTVTADVTWTNGTTFTTTDDVSGVPEEYEVEILSGVGAGKTAHVTQITGTTTYTVTVDEDLGAVLNDTSTVRFDNWMKMDDQHEEGTVYSWGITGGETQVQLKVILDGDIEVSEFIVKGNTKNET